MINTNTIIPIVFATNDSYMPYLGVALTSLIDNATKNNEYKIYILYTKMSLKNINKLESMGNNNIFIKCINISEKMKGIKVKTVAYPTIETTYRFFIPELFPEYNKILYLDCDIIILKDVAELYSVDIGDHVLGVVEEEMFPQISKYVEKKLELPISDYFNAGILLINCQRFNEEEIKSKCFAMLMGNRKYSYLDQDVLNIACYQKVKFIDRRWNFEWGFLISNQKLVIEGREKELSNLLSDPYIIHYVSKTKPWNKPNEELADYFWKYARNTIFYEEILYNNFNANTDSNEIDWFEDYLFPYNKLPSESNIILYGAGNLGNVYYNQLDRTRYATVIMWCDKNFNKVKKENVKILDPQKMCSVPFDYVVVAIVNQETAKEVEKYLMELGIPQTKIIWENPYRKKDKENMCNV